MLIWSGWGLLSVVIALVCVFIAVPFFDTTPIIGSLVFLLGAGANWVLGTKLNSRGQVMIDPETNEEVFVKSGTSSLFFIPMQWLSILFVLFAIALLLPTE